MKKHLQLIVLLLMAALTATATAQGLHAPGKFYIKSALTGKYVELQHEYLATVTATEEEAPELNVDYTAQDNGEGIITALNGGGGDMIATLDMIKGLIKSDLEYNNMPTDFLDEMFTLHLVPTGDADGSVYLCVDVPEIDNWETIKAEILRFAGGQQAVNYYITHMVPGNRHYLAVDYDDSFGFRVQSGADCKWIMIPVEDVPTAIGEVKAAADVDAPAYDLMGRKLISPSGIYIQNGHLHMK